MALSTNRFRTLTLLILATILLGILSRLVTTGVVLWDKYLGDALYAILVYLLLSLGRWRSLWGKALVALVIMVAIESFQLTGIPYQFSRRAAWVPRLVAIVLGTHFSWVDLWAYLVGIVAAAGVEWRWSK
ncbi:MAG: DUF2809 domain-containing protein [Caldilineaceae bacterium]